MTVPMVFENNEVEIIEFNGVILFNPRHVGICLDMEEVTVRRHIQSMSDKQVIKLTNTAVHSMNIRKLNNTGENFLTEAGVYKLVFKSRKPEAEKFTDWMAEVVLPSIRKTGSFSTLKENIPRTEAFELELIGLKYAAEILNMSEASKLGLVHKTYQSHNVPSTVLPEYVKAERVHFSASKLLEDHGKPLSAMAFNQLMIANGFLEEKTRPSSNGSTKTFKVLTDKSENFGLNLVSPKNDKETQPHYYEDSFGNLLKMLLNQE